MKPDYEAGLPARMRSLPRDPHGRPVPWFVAWIDGKPDFRIADQPKVSVAINRRVCWACGEPLGAYKAFLIGPMCAVNRNTAEPPCHTDCAVYCATHCDFLVSPKRGRREAFKPEGTGPPPGEMISRNPGVALVWVTRSFTLESDRGGVLFRLGEPTETHWFAEGRRASRTEVEGSINSGLPLLREMAEKEGPAAVAELDRVHQAALQFLPVQPSAERVA